MEDVEGKSAAVGGWLVDGGTGAFFERSENTQSLPLCFIPWTTAYSIPMPRATTSTSQHMCQLSHMRTSLERIRVNAHKTPQLGTLEALSELKMYTR
jgi:hypothetical protein